MWPFKSKAPKSEKTYPVNWRSLVEPVVQEVHDKQRDEPYFETQMTLSQTVSLKRIADSLEALVTANAEGQTGLKVMIDPAITRGLVR